VKDNHEIECTDVTWSIHKKKLNLYDHSYTNNIVLPCFDLTRKSNIHHIHNIEHNYCGGVNVGIDSNQSSENGLVDNERIQVKKGPDSPASDHNYVVLNKDIKNSRKCLYCGRVYKYEVTLQRHMKGCKNNMRITCRICRLICSSYKELYQHKMKEHQNGEKEKLQKEPWNIEKESPWNELEGAERENMRNIYNLHRGIILAPHHIADIVSIYNMPCQNDVNSTMIMKVVREIYNNSKRTFKVSFSAGMILQNIISREFRFWRPYRNQEFFTDPYMISSYNDLDDLKELLDTFDLYDYTLKQRPDTKFKCVLITNIQMFIFETSYTLGYETWKLPYYLTQNKHVVCFVKMLNGKYKRPYKDNLCAFRCISYHMDSEMYELSRSSFELSTLKMFKRWRCFMKEKHGQIIDAHNFMGVPIEQINLLEICFSLSIDVFEKLDKDTVIPVYKSGYVCSNRMVLNIHNRHLSYVIDLSRYTKKFKCTVCDKLFRNIAHLTRHTESCMIGSKIKFRGGLFNSTRDIWDELELFGLCIDTKDRKYTYFIVYDYECLLEKALIDFGIATKATSKHNPISVSTCGNCCKKHRKPLCIVEEKFDVLIQKWMVRLEEIAKHIREKTMKKWGKILISLGVLKKQLEPEKKIGNKDDTENTESSECEETSEDMIKALQKGNVYREFMKGLNKDTWSVNYNDWSSDESDDQEEEDEEITYDIINESQLKNIDSGTQLKMYNQISKLYDRFKEYINQIPILGYYSSKYDLLVIRSQLIKQLGLHIHRIKMKQKKTYYVIKRGESYPCISTGGYKFLDITEYIGGHVSYAQFLRSMKVTTGRKLFFPFNAVTEFKDLENGLPDMNSSLWYSDIKQKSLLDDGVDSIEVNYNLVKKVWCDNNMTTLRDLLIVYNNSDCGPFITAVEAFQSIFHNKNINVFKSGVISAPGLSRKLLFSTADEQNIPITLFDAKNSDLYYSFKKQCYGGASIIFSRHHKVDKTFIRGDTNNICQSILGIDGVALYLYCISGQMPIGFCIRRKEINKFKPEISDRALSTIHWLTWLNEHNKKHILHRYNTGGKERSLANFKFDGWDPIDKKGYELYGCYIHGHKYVNRYCFLSKDMDSDLAEKRYKQTESREKYIKQHCNIKVIWECSYYNLVKSNKELQNIINKSRPIFYKKHKGCVKPEQILKAVQTDKIFGFIEVDITVKEDEISKRGENGMTKYDYLKEMCPLFGTAEIKYDDISGVMKTFMEENNISKAPRRQLVATLSGKQIMLHSSLLKFYLEIGLHVTRIYQVVEYVGYPVFKPFSDMIMKYRREASQDVEKAPLAQMFKIIGNSGMYIIIHNNLI
jgi:uncharacterized Zn-finger protein